MEGTELAINYKDLLLMAFRHLDNRRPQGYFANADAVETTYFFDASWLGQFASSCSIIWTDLSSVLISSSQPNLVFAMQGRSEDSSTLVLQCASSDCLFCDAGFLWQTGRRITWDHYEQSCNHHFTTIYHHEPEYYRYYHHFVVTVGCYLFSVMSQCWSQIVAMH